MSKYHYGPPKHVMFWDDTTIEPWTEHADEDLKELELLHPFAKKGTVATINGRVYRKDFYSGNLSGSGKTGSMHPVWYLQN